MFEMAYLMYQFMLFIGVNKEVELRKLSDKIVSAHHELQQGQEEADQALKCSKTDKDYLTKTYLEQNIGYG